MDDLRALAEALAYLEGQGSAAPADPEARAAVVIAQLVSRGFAIRPMSGSLLNDRGPATLMAARRALNLTRRRLAREAGVDVSTVARAESVDFASQEGSLSAIVAALKRLGAGKR